MLPKEKPGLTQDGKVAVYIKHLGHKTPGTNQYVHKERQGFLLLPVVQQKMEEKLKELKEQLKQDYQSSYQGDEQTRHKQRFVIFERKKKLKFLSTFLASRKPMIINGENSPLTL